MTLNIRPSEAPCEINGPVRVLYTAGKWQVPPAQRPADWRERTKAQAIPTDWFPTRLERISCPGIGTFKQPSEEGKRKRAAAFRNRKAKAAKTC